MPAKYTYLALMLFTLAGPLLLSFDKRVSFFRKWKYLPVPLLVTTVYFVTWDSNFTINGIWSFNDKYILGWRIFELPIEEWMFFWFVPFACIFIYECCNYYIKRDILGNYAQKINGVILFIITVIAVMNIQRAYTAFNFISAAVLMAYLQFISKPAWLGRFYVGYLFSLLPFFLINGVLTYLPVVSYDNTENLGIRLYTIPVEDTIYCLLLLLLNVSIYEKLKAKKQSSVE